MHRLRACRHARLYSPQRRPPARALSISSSSTPLLPSPFDLDDVNPARFSYPAIVLDLPPANSSSSSAFSVHAQRIAAYLQLPLFSSHQSAIGNQALLAVIAPSSPPLPSRLRFVLSYSSTLHLLSAHTVDSPSPSSPPLLISPSSVFVSFSALYTAKVLQGRFTTGSPLLSALSCAQTDAAASTPSVLDLTGGFCSDAFIAACHGFRVNVVETDAVLCALVHNGMERARQLPRLQPAIDRLQLHHADSLQLQPSAASRAAVAYVDSFYPPGKSSSKSKKNISFARLLSSIRAEEKEEEGQKGSTEDAVLQSLIAKAMQLSNRVVVKRPTRAACPVPRAVVMQHFTSRDTRYYVLNTETYRQLQLCLRARSESLERHFYTGCEKAAQAGRRARRQQRDGATLRAAAQRACTCCVLDMQQRRPSTSTLS